MSTAAKRTDSEDAAGLTVLGCERLFDDRFDLIAGMRVGLITNPSGVDRQLRTTADRLHETDGVELAALFGPEHGIRGQAADGVHVVSTTDARTGVPLHSLYGPQRQPDDAMLAGLDLILFDMQDVGVRFYTYLYTMSLAMEACAGRGLPFVVLDRPNPVGGDALEGNLLDPAFASFVGRYPIPVRYGLSIGELATLFNETFAIGVELVVVEMRDWHRASYWDATGLPWTPPSPNMPAVDTAVLYPGTCFLEGTNVSEGRGTSKPFEQVGSPFIDGHKMADHLNDLDLPGCRFRPVHFQPSQGKYDGEDCQGVQVHVTDRASLPPVRTGLEMVSAVRQLWPEEFAWRVPDGGIHNFDSLAGSDAIRKAIDAGTPVVDILESDRVEQEAFLRTRRRYLRYGSSASSSDD